MCTVGDALSDLPPFDWINPHGVIEQTQLEKLDREHRWKSINQYEVERGEKFVGRNHQSYAYSRPLSEFQRRVRAGVSKDTLFNHVTMRWNEETTERVCSIPLRPGADHRDMPKALGIDFLSNATAARHRFYPGRFGRLDMDGIFQTCMADMTPSGKNGKVGAHEMRKRTFTIKLILFQVIHPTQKRVISIREYARAQSFPDWFVFDLENSRMIDIIRQIGNAVPPNLAFALGRELLKVLVQKHEEDQWTPENMKTENCSQGHEELGHGQGSREDPISFDDDDDDDDE
jgi:site-specific DNA-cytosine methylase